MNDKSFVIGPSDLRRERWICGASGVSCGLLIGIILTGGLYQSTLRLEQDRNAHLRACEPSTGEQAVLRRGHDGVLHCDKALLSQRLLGDLRGPR